MQFAKLFSSLARQLECAVTSPERLESDLSNAPLTPIFNPKSVAVIGATEKPASVGRTVLRNLLDQPFGNQVLSERSGDR
jgi:hypothetical protein